MAQRRRTAAPPRRPDRVRDGVRPAGRRRLPVEVDRAQPATLYTKDQIVADWAGTPACTCCTCPRCRWSTSTS
ncbi:hypothetical protein NKG94_01985 [Micromonospora sp. M12]